MQIRKVKSTGRMVGIAVAVALIAGAALAFEPQQAGPASKPDASAPALSPDLNKELGLTDPMAPLPKQGPGTEVRIPGLGVIGVIPKMDFGLELLYGASEPSNRGLPTDDADGGDLAVKGRVKRSF